MPADHSPGAEPAEGSSKPAHWTGGEPSPAWTSLVARNRAAKERLSHLARTIDAEVIPRLAKAQRSGREGEAAPVLAEEVQGLVRLLLSERNNEASGTVSALRQRGVAVEAIYLDLLAPAARLLGEMWCNDVCDFAAVTWGVGRLHSLMRELGPDFCSEVQLAPSGRRVLFAQPSDEQHSFGLSMLADFFRRQGWQVLGGVGGTVEDPATTASQDFVDAVGLSIGSRVRLGWARQCIADIRARSCNPHVLVLVGGPLLTLHPECAGEIGADGTALDARTALAAIEGLLLRPMPST